MDARQWSERLSYEEMSLVHVQDLLDEAREIQERAFPQVLGLSDRQDVNDQFHCMLGWLTQSRNILRRNVWERGLGSVGSVEVDPDIAKPHIISVILVHVDSSIRRAAEVLWR